MPNPKITKIENIYFAHQIENMGTDYNGFNQVYQQGATLPLTPCVVCIHTSIGVTGECLGPPVPENVARYLLGRNPFARERIYNDLKRGLRHSARTDICAVDVALWDFAGKVYDAPIWQLLGGWRETIPRLCFDLPRRRKRRPEYTGGLCRLCRAVRGDRLSRVQDSRLGQCSYRPRGGQCARSWWACGRPHGP